MSQPGGGDWWTIGLNRGRVGVCYELAEQFGMDVLDRSAAFVPLTFSDQWKFLCERLAGLSTDVVMASSGQSFREGSLFAHRGLSGPVSLQVSSYWSPGQLITINLMPECDASGYLLDAKGHHGNLLVRTVLTQLLPKTLVNELEGLSWSSYETTPLAEISDAVLRKIRLNLSAWNLRSSGTEQPRSLYAGWIRVHFRQRQRSAPTIEGCISSGRSSM